MSKNSRIKELELSVADMSEHIGRLNNIIFKMQLRLDEVATIKANMDPAWAAPGRVPLCQPYGAQYFLYCNKKIGVETGT